MPDIDFQKINLNLIPKKGDEPVIFYASQYETTRPFIADLFWGDSEFVPGDSCWAEIDIRKNDNNLVVITDDVSIDNNEVSVILPVQALTCIGKNLGQVKIYAGDEQLIAALNFILEVQPDPLAGGVDSETAIDNLESQIAAIVPEVIGDDYYDKTEVDALLADKADASTTYTKTEVDNALALKANSSDLATVATTGDYDDLINKPVIPAAQIQSDYTQADTTAVDYIKNKPDIAGMIADAIFNILPVGIASGNPCSFNTEIAGPLQALTAEIVASGGGGTPQAPNPIVGHSELNLVRCGKNLVSNKIENANIESSGNINAISNFNCFYCRVVAGVTYTITTADVNLVYAFYDILPDIGVTSYDGTRTVTLLTNNTVTAPITGYLVFRSNDTSFTQAQVEVGNQATAYAPYNGQTFTVSFGQTVYGGVYDANRGKVRSTWASVELGSLNYVQYVVGSKVLYKTSETIPMTVDYSDPKMKCAIYTPVSWSEINYGATDDEMGKDADGHIFIYDTRFTSMTPEQVKSALSDVILAYELATPIEIDVSELSVSAIVGVNNITSDGGGDVSVSYKDSIQHYIDNQ